MGQKRRSDPRSAASAPPRITNIIGRSRHARKVPDNGPMRRSTLPQNYTCCLVAAQIR
jgi:hypothetical protein